MSSLEHPIRTAEVHTFQRTDSGSGTVAWLARFYPYSTYPVFFQGSSEADVVTQAEVLRTKAIEEYEEAYIKRESAKVKRKETLAKKKENTDE
tara:strand:+ start:758 stop:1036 length:279 start_codon:yes stop_codon:yes gene_type:complete